MTIIHIPPAALEAGARALAAVRMPNYTWDDLDREMQDYLRGDARAAFEAMVGAWGGMHMEDESAPWVPRLILPLTEKTDDMA